jgi:DNA-binding NarL/FixJ family response regulator
MTEHIFINSDGIPRSRWTAAFPSARGIAAHELAAETLPGGGIVWLLAGEDDVQTLRGLVSARHDLPVVVLSLHPGQAEAVLVLGAGARGYCHALAAPAMLQQVALVVANGGLWVGPELMGQLIVATQSGGAGNSGDVADQGADPREGLTSRERAVADEVVQGRTNKEIAVTLGITERTVKAHLGAIFAKLGVRDRLQLALRLRSRAPAGRPLPESA